MYSIYNHQKKIENDRKVIRHYPSPSRILLFYLFLGLFYMFDHVWREGGSVQERGKDIWTSKIPTGRIIKPEQLQQLAPSSNKWKKQHIRSEIPIE